MKMRLKKIAILWLLLFTFQTFFSQSISFAKARDFSKSESSQLAAAQWEDFACLPKSQHVSETNHNNQPVLIPAVVAKNPAVAKQVKYESYSLTNILQYNLPLVTYKFPRSEHSEAG